MMDGWMIMNGVGGRHVAWGFIHLTTDGRVRATGQGQGTAGSHGHGTGEEVGGETYAVGRLQMYGTAKEHVEGGAEQSDSKSIRINK